MRISENRNATQYITFIDIMAKHYRLTEKTGYQQEFTLFQLNPVKVVKRLG